jgi:hypothetical protein
VVRKNSNERFVNSRVNEEISDQNRSAAMNMGSEASLRRCIRLPTRAQFRPSTWRGGQLLEKQFGRRGSFGICVLFGSGTKELLLMKSDHQT